MAELLSHWALDKNEIALTIAPILALVAWAHNSMLLLYHLFCFFKSKTRPKLYRHSLLFLLVIWLFLIVLFLNEYRWAFPTPPHPALDPFALMDCIWRIRITVVSWTVYRFSLFYFFLGRLFSIFRTVPALKFKPIHILSSRIGLFICWAANQSLIVFIRDDPSDMAKGFCIPIFPEWVMAVVIIGDFIFCTSIQVMFTRRLLALNMQTVANRIDGTDSTTAPSATVETKTMKIARKSTVLTVVALISSELALCCIVLTKIVHIWLAVDCVINGWCIMLIFQVHSRMFDAMCCLCHTLVDTRCLSCYSCHCCCRIQNK